MLYNDVVDVITYLENVAIISKIKNKTQLQNCTKNIWYNMHEETILTRKFELLFHGVGVRHEFNSSKEEFMKHFNNEKENNQKLKEFLDNKSFGNLTYSTKEKRR